MSRRDFLLLARSSATAVCGGPPPPFERSGLLALQEAAEAHVSGLFREAARVALHAGRGAGLLPIDIRLAARAGAGARRADRHPSASSAARS